jgi:nitrite reductase/ring-hydroxylating ferredoxin subunit
MSESGLTCVGVYERTLPTSTERVWENVRDWEHLPWLHASSFSSIACEEEGEWGWRARIGLGGDNEILLELVIEPDEPRYVSRTLEGGAVGSEIWTTVEQRGESQSHVVVEFWLPEVAPDRVNFLGDLYVNLYTQLWDEDESMMVRRADELCARRERRRAAVEPQRLSLGALGALREKLPRIVRRGGDDFRIVEVDGALLAHAIICPHSLGPLEAADVVDGRVTCPWHGYAFEVATGRECSGRRLRLSTARVEVDADEQVWLLP